MARSQFIQEESANKSCEPTPAFAVCDEVWFNARNICTERPSHKLDYKQIDLYGIIEKFGSHAYRLQFRAMKIHKVFHVSHLSLARKDPYPKDDPIFGEGNFKVTILLCKWINIPHVLPLSPNGTKPYVIQQRRTSTHMVRMRVCSEKDDGTKLWISGKPGVSQEP